MTGRDLRLQIDAFDDVLIDTREFLREQDSLTEEIEALITQTMHNLQDLFYFIPLEETGDE